jgi:hypothetical protein
MITTVPLPFDTVLSDGSPMTPNSVVFHPTHGRCLFSRPLLTRPGRAYVEKNGSLIEVSVLELKTLAVHIAEVASVRDAALESHLQACAEAVASGFPLIMPTTPCDYTAHVNSNPALTVKVELGYSGFDKFASWFQGVTHTTLTGNEEWLRLVRPDTNWEPRVRLPYHQNMLLPHPVVAAGTVGKGHGLETPQFLFHYPMMLENNYQSYFEGILRAGWRP